MNAVTYGINSAWKGASEQPELIGEKFLKVLEIFERLDPAFTRWWTSLYTDDLESKSPPPVAISTLRSSITDWVRKSVWIDDLGDPDPAQGGYWLCGMNGYPPESISMERLLRFIVVAGSKLIDHTSFEIGTVLCPPDPRLVSYPIFKGALLALVSVWPAPWANAYCSTWGRDLPVAPGEPPFPVGYRKPWICYLSPARSARLGPLPDLITERTPDGGLLISAAETRFDPTNLDHMRRSRRIAEILIEHGGDPYHF